MIRFAFVGGRFGVAPNVNEIRPAVQWEAVIVRTNAQVKKSRERLMMYLKVVRRVSVKTPRNVHFDVRSTRNQNKVDQPNHF